MEEVPEISVGEIEIGDIQVKLGRKDYLKIFGLIVLANLTTYTMISVVEVIVEKSKESTTNG